VEEEIKSITANFSLDSSDKQNEDNLTEKYEDGNGVTYTINDNVSRDKAK
jgi:hypothetical protein